MDDSFSLQRLEYLVYSQHREEAASELINLLNILHLNNGFLGDLGNMPSGHVSSDLRDSHFATRIASAITTLFSDPSFKLTDSGYLRLIPCQRWFGIILGASPFVNADHIIRVFNERGFDNFEQLTLNDSDLLKFCLLYSPDSNIPVQVDVLWQKNKRLAATLFAALLSSRVVATDEAHQKREVLLGWLPSKLKEISLDDLPIQIIHDVWMHCSYAQRPDKHLIKRAINELVRLKLLYSGMTDLEPPTNKPDKPTIFCIVEWFNSIHSIYRTHSVSMAALREKYYLVGISLRENVDAITKEVFDEIHVMSKDEAFLDTIGKIRELAALRHPEIVYYPSVGMFPETIYLINLRLAPIQMAALGHPATTHSPFIDYVLVEEDYLGDPNCFSETVVALPKDSIPYRPPANCPSIPPNIRTAPDPVRIAVPASVIKINPTFLGVLRQIADRCNVQFHFLSGAAIGLTKVYLQNIVRRFLDDNAVVYPHLPYDQYLAKINDCDIFVNPFPFGNTNGIVDTVRQGLPGVCLTGPEVHSHIDEGLFRRLGLPDWLIATSHQEYIEATVRLVTNSAEREALSHSILRTNPDSILFSGNPRLFLDAVQWLHDTHTTRTAKSKSVLRLPATSS